MAREIFEAFKGQQDMFGGNSQATRVGGTIYVAGTVGIGEGMHVPEPMAEQTGLLTATCRNAHPFRASMSDVVEQRVYVTNIDEASAALEARKAA